MFYKKSFGMFRTLVRRNSKRNRKENSLFFFSLLISIIAFYIVLSLSNQDVMLFLQKMESDAVNKLMAMIPLFYGMTLIILFFLIYYAGSFQMERRSHEFGMYLIFGLRRSKLFLLLLAEDFSGSVLALVIGIPVAVLISELTSLVTAKVVGLGIIGHQSSFSLRAVLWTAVGFLLIKSVAFLVLSGKIVRQEVGSLLLDTPKGAKKQKPTAVYLLSLFVGLTCLTAAFGMPAGGISWSQMDRMGYTIVLGLLGTGFLFYGLRFVMNFLARRGNSAPLSVGRGKADHKNSLKLQVFDFRQLEETVIHHSGAMAVSFLLILAALCCFGSGVAITRDNRWSKNHVLDYTFLDDAESEKMMQAASGVSQDDAEDEKTVQAASGLSQNGAEEEKTVQAVSGVSQDRAPQGGADDREAADNNEGIVSAVQKTLTDRGLDTQFSRLFEIKVGYIRTTEDYEHAFQMETVMDALSGLPKSDAREILLNNLGYESNPRLISLSGYNVLLDAAGLPMLKLEKGEAGVYIDPEFTDDERTRILNTILSKEPEAVLDGAAIRLTGEVQTTSLVTDRMLTLSFALILPDEQFEYYTQGDCSVYLDGVLDEETVRGESLLQAISAMNQKLDEAGLLYESFLQNMGRQLFYTVSASYLTIYLAVIFLIVANTVIGVQFLMGQQKAGRRYRTLVRLGADYGTLCQSAVRQINWYFGIPVVLAAVGSLFGERALLTGILAQGLKESIPELMRLSIPMLLLLFAAECFYMTLVKRISARYLLTLMEPEREE